MTDYRALLLADITTKLSGSSFNVSSELPWESGDTPLFLKNLKRFYLDVPNTSLSEFILTFNDNCDGYYEETQIEGYLAMNAKNLKSDLQQSVRLIMQAKDSIPDQISGIVEMSTEITGDVLVYTFVFTFTTLYSY
ncbi:MAG: hypothetical protein GY886_01855 [Gammaproteobacteria bacterium]|nr:hypothetical protein [Gammaproteobacteria bacterium]